MKRPGLPSSMAFGFAFLLGVSGLLSSCLFPISGTNFNLDVTSPTDGSMVYSSVVSFNVESVETLYSLTVSCSKDLPDAVPAGAYTYYPYLTTYYSSYDVGGLYASGKSFKLYFQATDDQGNLSETVTVTLTCY